jgi:hypothetical protein
MCHPNDETAIRYFSGELTENEQLEIDGHVAGCDDCLSRMRALLYIRENFTSIWEKWSAAEHGRIYEQLHIIKAMLEITKKMPSMADQVVQCFRAAKEGLGIGAKVLLDGAKRIASFAPTALPAGYEFKFRVAYAGIGSPEEQAQLEDHLAKGSKLLSEDKVDHAVHELLKAGKIDARSPQAAVSEVRHEGRLMLQMIVDSNRRRISVKFWPQERMRNPAFAILLPEQVAIKPLIGEFKSVEGEEYILAEFVDVSDSMYFVQIGPITTNP